MKSSQYRIDDLEIREFKAEDKQALANINQQARRSELALAGISISGALQNEPSFPNQAGFKVMISFLKSEIVGFVEFSDSEISRIHVSPAHQGRGVARRLLRHALENIEGTANAEVLAANERALTLCFRHGFDVMRRTSIEIPETGTVAQGYMLQRKAPAVVSPVSLAPTDKGE